MNVNRAGPNTNQSSTSSTSAPRFSLAGLLIKGVWGVSTMMATASALSSNTTVEQRAPASFDPDGGLSDAALPVAAVFLGSSLLVGLGICCAIKNRYFSCKKETLPQDKILLASVKVVKPYTDDPDVDPEEVEQLIFATKESFEAGSGINQRKYGRYLRTVGVRPGQVITRIFARDNLGCDETRQTPTAPEKGELGSLESLQPPPPPYSDHLSNYQHASAPPPYEDTRSNKSSGSRRSLFSKTLLDSFKSNPGSEDEDELVQGINHEVMATLLNGKKVLEEAEKVQKSFLQRQAAFSNSPSLHSGSATSLYPASSSNLTSLPASGAVSSASLCASSVNGTSSAYVTCNDSPAHSRAASIASLASLNKPNRSSTPNSFDVPQDEVATLPVWDNSQFDEVDFGNFGASAAPSTNNLDSSANLSFLQEPRAARPTSSRKKDLFHRRVTNPFLSSTLVQDDTLDESEFEMTSVAADQTRLFNESSKLFDASFDLETTAHQRPEWFHNKPVQCGEYSLCRLANMVNVGDPNFLNDPNYPVIKPFLFTDFSYAIGCGIDIPYCSFSTKHEAYKFLERQNKRRIFIVTTRTYGGHHFAVYHDGSGWVSDDQITGLQKLNAKGVQFIKEESQESSWFEVTDKRALLALITMQKIQKSLGDSRKAEWGAELQEWIKNSNGLDYESSV